MEDRETLRSLIYELVRRIDDEAGVPTPAQIAASLRALSKRLAIGYNGVGVPRRTLTESTELEPTPGIRPSWRADRKRDRAVGQPRRGVMWYSAVSLLAVALFIMGWTGIAYHVKSIPSFVPTEYTTANGQRATITLSDGSTALLDVASRLTVPADYAAGHHTVSLVGEALFTVSHHERAPFTVLAGSVTTRVLGTSFLVRHYATDTATTVVVRDGKVGVHARTRRPVVLTAARQVTIGPAGAGDVQGADPTQFSFATGVLTLKDVPFPEAIAELDRWYDVDIRLGDPALKARRVTGENAAGSVAELQAVLEWTFNMRVVRRGRVLTLFPR